MGADAPKSAELIIELEDQVKDAILSEDLSDPIFNLILALIMNSIQTERPLFPNPLEEPAFYQTYLRRWVEEGLGELKEIKRLAEKSGENG